MVISSHSIIIGVIFEDLSCYLVFNATIIPVKHGNLEELNRAHIFLTVIEM